MLLALACGMAVAPACVCGSSDGADAVPSGRRPAAFQTPSARTVVVPHDWQPPRLQLDAGDLPR